MAKFVVHLQPLITVLVDTDDPPRAAQEARDRLLGLLRETPPAIQSIGFMPDYPYQVFDNKRHLMIEGTDNDLSPSSGSVVRTVATHGHFRNCCDERGCRSCFCDERYRDEKTNTRTRRED